MNDDRDWSGDMTDSGFFGTEGGDGAEALDPAVIELVDELMAHAPPGREGLIRVLLGLQQAFDRVSWRVQELVADRYAMSPAQVAGIVSYYPKLSAQRQGRQKLEICTGTGCWLRGGEGLLEAARRGAAAQNSMTEEPRVAVQQQRCFGICGLAPAVRINDRVQAPNEESRLDKLTNALLDPGPSGRGDNG